MLVFLGFHFLLCDEHASGIRTQRCAEPEL
jgi:hypothetical protein